MLAATADLRGRLTDAYTQIEPAPEVMLDGNSNSDLHIFPSPQEFHGSYSDFELIPGFFFFLILCVEDTTGSQNRPGDKYLIF